MLGLLLFLSGLQAFAAAPTAGIRQAGGLVEVGVPADPGGAVAIEAQEAFLAGAPWRSIATVGATNRPVFVADPTCSTKPQNFYRLRLLQGAVPVEVPNFRLLDLEGRAHELFYHGEAPAVVLLLAGPSLDSLAPHAAELAGLRTANPSVRFFAILAADGRLVRSNALAAATALGLNFPVLEDEGCVLTRELASGPDVPEAVVLRPGFWTVSYRGRIADGAGAARHALLADALAAELGGRPALVRHTEPFGTRLELPNLPDAEYATDIAPLLQKHCVKCHSPGNIAPWAMTNHAVIEQFAALIKDEVLTRRMPPWHADPHHLAMSNDDMPAPADLAKLVGWLDRGAPRGGGPDPLAESIPPPPPDWPLGTPDRILRAKRYSIPAAGTVDYKYEFTVSPFPSNVWLRAAVVRPSNRRVMHHVLVFSGGAAELEALQGGLAGYFAAFVPGQAQDPFPAGTGKLLKRGDIIVWQLHYTATGQPETDQTELGFYLHPTAPAKELKTTAAFDTGFVIPAGAPDHGGAAEYAVTRDILLYELSPHMHYRGSRFRFDAIYPGGARETLVNVPYYRFDWQSLYRLAEPKRLPAGTRIVCAGGWDNSAANPYNPNPGQAVTFGEQSWEEMFIGYFNYAPAP
ncbi:MAG: hypothetical protein ACKVYV_17015 [Limisphaerales bacterium]